jgi:type IV secretory pathway VirB10-like protein
MNLLQRFSLWLSKNPMQRSLYLLVPTVHLIFFIVFSQSNPPKKVISPKKLVVKTYTARNIEPSLKTTTLKAKPTQQKKLTKTAATPPPKAKKETAPKLQNKAPVLKKITPQKITPQKTTIARKKEVPQVQKQNLAREKHLKELQERIAKIEAKNDRIPIKSELAVPTTLTLSSQQTPKEATPDKSSLNDEDITASLIGYLQGFLNLPEIGEVQIQIALQKNGSVETMKVIRTDSEKNRKYLEEQLPKLSFPQAYLNGSSSRSFLLTFCNKF